MSKNNSVLFYIFGSIYDKNRLIIPFYISFILKKWKQVPQYHRVIENDEWWGKGFTDWVSTRNAEPLFRGHNQPNFLAQQL